MQRTNFASMPCPIAQTLDVVCDGWTLLIVREAFLGLRRFEDFQAQLGIARNTLSHRLKRLVEDGVLEEQAYQERPRRLEYRLTAKGRDLFPVLAAMVGWGNRWGVEGRGGDSRLAHRDTGEVAEPRLVCARRGTPLTPATVFLKSLRTGRAVDRLARRRVSRPASP